MKHSQWMPINSKQQRENPLTKNQDHCTNYSHTNDNW